MERQITLGDVIAPAKVLRCDNDDYPVLSMTMHDGIVLQSDRFKKSLASIDQSNYKVVLRGQLVVGFPIDEGVIYVQNITEAGIMSPAYGVWNIHSKEIMPEYLELCLHSPQSMDYYKNKLRGTTARRRSITTEDLLALPITLPSLTEQKRRIGLLQQATLLLNSQKQAMLKFDELVKSRFVEMFETDRFPYTTIGNLVERKVGAAKKDFASTDTIKYIDISSIDNKRNIMTGYTEYILADAPSRAQQHICKGDIVVSTVRPNLKNVASTPFDDDNLVASSGFCVLRPRKCLPSYLMAVVCSDEFTKAMTNVVTGANYPAIKDSDVMNYPVRQPPMDLQQEFAAFVAEVDKSKLAVKQSLEKLETLKKSLMQQYFG